MDSLRQYVISVIAAALISGVVIRLTQNGSGREIIRMLCGVFMTIVLILPISGRQTFQWKNLLPEIDRQAEVLASDGAYAAGNMKAELIKQQTEAYILDRATAMNADVTVTVSLGMDCVPASVRIAGKISPLSRSRLTDVITTELGIPREQQEWIG